MAAFSGGHPPHRHQILPCFGRDVHVLGQAAGELVAERLAVLADVLVLLAAGGTDTAADQRVNGDLVAHGNSFGQWPVRIDDSAGELVPQHCGERDVLLLAALIDTNIGAAQQGSVDPQENVTQLQCRHRHLFSILRSLGRCNTAWRNVRPGWGGRRGAEVAESEVVVTAECLSGR